MGGLYALRGARGPSQGPASAGCSECFVQMRDRLLEERPVAPVAGDLQILKGACSSELQRLAAALAIPFFRCQFRVNRAIGVRLRLGDLVLHRFALPAARHT